ncbi:MAG: hypothetical protein LBT66_01085 [Methanobrevibacter sp.]|jgi:nitrogenase molybdenum-iron protein alpha chain|nr:hypothetical protein [Candidatus Methanovirga meridionalis]
MSLKKSINVSPIRDTRLNTIITFGGNASELVDLTSKKCLKDNSRSFTQTTFCQEWLALLTLSSIEDTVIISHAPVGCAGSLSCITIFRRYGQINRGIQPSTGTWISTNLSGEEVIHGGSSKLKDAIFKAEKRHSPKAIFVYTSCVSGIVGEDIEGVINEVQDKVSAKVLPVYCEGFKSKIWASGYDGAFHGVLNHLIEEPKEKQDNLVNVINPISFSSADEVELRRILSNLSLEANFIPNFAKIEDIAKASEAALTSSICTTFSEYFAKRLDENYGIPYTERVMPVGLDNTDAWVREIASYLGKEKEAEELIKSERDKIQPQINIIKEKLEGKTAFISAGQSRAIGVPSLLADFGMKILGVTAYHYDEVVFEGFKELEKKCGNFCINIANVQPYEQANILEKEKPDFYFGHMGESVWAVKEGFPAAMVFSLINSIVGYNGAVAFGNRILNLINNPSFSKTLSKHSKSPYSKKWFDENPFKYHKEGEKI